MRYEVWLENNRRVYRLAAGLALFVALIGLGGVALFWTSSRFLVGLGLVLAGGALLGLTWSLFRRPRLAYADGHLLVYVQGPRPIAVPIELVECFFLGQGPSRLPATLEGRQGEAAVAATVVVRLAEAAEEWHHRDVSDRLGQWCEGYIILRGTWCEPLTAETMGRLNRLLVAAHRERRQTTTEVVSA